MLHIKKACRAIGEITGHQSGKAFPHLQSGPCPSLATDWGHACTTAAKTPLCMYSRFGCVLVYVIYMCRYMYICAHVHACLSVCGVLTLSIYPPPSAWDHQQVRGLCIYSCMKLLHPCIYIMHTLPIGWAGCSGCPIQGMCLCMYIQAWAPTCTLTWWTSICVQYPENQCTRPASLCDTEQVPQWITYVQFHLNGIVLVAVKPEKSN